MFDTNNDLVFYVSDTGMGIPSDKLDIIFERFIQLPHDKNITFGGTGLGLSIVKGLITILKGRIWLESIPENLSEGKAGKTTFYFSIPVNKDPK
jgi:signal transduction histidine kinase